MNNTEGVLIGPEAPGEYTVRVVASNINSDAIPDVGSATDQDFALVCYNCAPDSHFTLAATPNTVDACIPGVAESNIDIGQTCWASAPRSR